MGEVPRRTVILIQLGEKTRGGRPTLASIVWGIVESIIETDITGWPTWLRANLEGGGRGFISRDGKGNKQNYGCGSLRDHPIR